MDGRDMRMYDGRRLPPRNSRGEFRRRRRGDRGMDYGMQPEMRMDGRVIRSYPTIHPQGDYRGDMNYDMARGENQGGRGRGDMRGRDYATSETHNMDMRGGYSYDRMGDMARSDYGYDGHYQHGRQSGYEPVEFMGYCQGYYGSPDHGDYGRGRDYGDMRGRRDYGYDDYADYGSVLSEKELDEWCHKLKGQLDEREKQMFSKEMISQKAKQMGKPMEGFGEKELEVVTLMLLDDYKQTLGVNVDVMIKLAYDWLNDKDAKRRGAEKLAVYYDEIVMGGEDD